jgi:allantoicase
VLRVVFTILVWLQLCTSALHVGRSVFCFQEPLLGASQLVLPGRQQPLEEGWETVSVTR